MKKTALILLILWVLSPVRALADIEISPLRHVLSEDAREVVISVSNPSRRILDGRVTWIDLTATEDGYAPADRAARTRMSAAPYLVVSPARFHLEPGARTTVAIRLRDDKELPPGERRSHLLFETSASRTPIRKASDSGMQVDIGLSVSVPVLVRSRGRAEARIGETKLLRDEQGLLLLATTIEPLGSHSSYGRLTATFKSEDGEGGAQSLGVIENVAGYLDATSRKYEIPLGYESLGKGELTLRYEGAAEFSGRLFDERKFDIAPPGSG